MAWTRLCGIVAVVSVALLAPGSAVAARMGSPSIAAVQVALRAKGLYSGTVDGFAGPGTAAAIRSLQRRAGISVDGVVGPQTLRSLGRRGRPPLRAPALSAGQNCVSGSGARVLLSLPRVSPRAFCGGLWVRT